MNLLDKLHFQVFENFWALLGTAMRLSEKPLEAILSQHIFPSSYHQDIKPGSPPSQPSVQHQFGDKRLGFGTTLLFKVSWLWLYLWTSFLNFITKGLVQRCQSRHFWRFFCLPLNLDKNNKEIKECELNTSEKLRNFQRSTWQPPNMMMSGLRRGSNLIPWPWTEWPLFKKQRSVSQKANSTSLWVSHRSRVMEGPCERWDMSPWRLSVQLCRTEQKRNHANKSFLLSTVLLAKWHWGWSFVYSIPTMMPCS